MRVQFIKSAVEPKGYPTGTKPEVACVGRSNSGKSSLINGLCETKIAKISSQPGKTVLLNFFDVGDHYRLVDMPGYGFAGRSFQDRQGWKTMVETYLSTRSQLAGLLLVMDIRRSWAKQEEGLVQWMKPVERPIWVILTKMDKVSQGKARVQSREIQRASGLESVFSVSSLKGTGIRELEKQMFANLIKPEIS